MFLRLVLFCCFGVSTGAFGGETESDYKMVVFKISKCPMRDFKILGSKHRRHDAGSRCRDFEKFAVRGNLSASKEHSYLIPAGPVPLIAEPKPSPFLDYDIYMRIVRGVECQLEIAYPTKNGEDVELRASHVANFVFKDAKVSGRYLRSYGLVRSVTGCPWQEVESNKKISKLQMYDHLGDWGAPGLPYFSQSIFPDQRPTVDLEGKK